MHFEWDAEKAESNRLKHDITFAVAAGVFARGVVEIRDDRRDYGEERIKAIGERGGEIIAVVYTWRGNARRIISARRANGRERAAYRSLHPGDCAAG